MNFNDLQQNIRHVSGTFRQNAVAAVNTHLTVRNWLVGFYIVEFEQNGEDPLKRRFYEVECIKGTWSVRELKRQIDTLYFERSGISRKPEKLSEVVQAKSEKNAMQRGDNPPVGILLVTNKNNALVEYAVADNDQELFVSKYLVELPDKKYLERFVNQEYAKMNNR